MIGRVLAVLHARNLEFLRDRGTLLFTLLLPVSLVVGMGLVFGGPERALFKVGVLGQRIERSAHPFLRERYVEFLAVPGERAALHKLTHQQIDLLVDLHAPLRYWVNTDSPKGYIAEKLLLAAAPDAARQPVSGAALRYIDWLFPGILGMNMMFSCLFGVGYVVLRYRKSGFLKRLHATPLTAFEFLTAQVLSRLALILTVTAILYAGIGAVIGFHSAGNLAVLALLAVLGALSMIALGLTIAARFSSEELVGGLLNLLTWPMMLLSGIWFSL
jgi:ABC-2 type transport system permease protein